MMITGNRNCEHYCVYDMRFNDNEHTSLSDVWETDSVSTYEEAKADAERLIAHLTPGELKKRSIWIQGWNGEEFPEYGADYEEEIN